MKKIGCSLLVIIILILLTILAVSFCIKNIVINSINSEIVSKEVASKVVSVLKEYNVSYEELSKIENNIINSDTTHKITEKYVSGLLDNISNNSELATIIDENVKYIQSDSYGITDETKKEIVRSLSNEDKFNKIYKTISNAVKDNLSETEKEYITIYNRFISNEFRLILISVIIISIILIAVIKKSYYKWMLDLAISFLLSGIFILTILPMFVDFVVNDIINTIGEYKINLSYLLNIGYIYIGLFGVLILIFLVIEKINKRINDSYEY